MSDDAKAAPKKAALNVTSMTAFPALGGKKLYDGAGLDFLGGQRCSKAEAGHLKAGEEVQATACEAQWCALALGCGAQPSGDRSGDVRPQKQKQKQTQAKYQAGQADVAQTDVVQSAGNDRVAVPATENVTEGVHASFSKDTAAAPSSRMFQ